MRGTMRGISRTGGSAALRALLALVLAIGMSPAVPSVAWADPTDGSGAQTTPRDNGIATVNGQACDDLSSVIDAAKNAAASGQTVNIVLQQDVKGSEEAGFEIPEGMTVVLDLNGHDLVGNNAGVWIANHGSLTINDTVYAKSSGTDGGHVYTTNVEDQGRAAIQNYGTLKINGGFFGDKNSDRTDANGVQRGNAVRNYGTATIDGGSFTCCDNYTNGGYAYAIANDDGSYPDATMTINNATVYGSVNGLIASDGGTLTVNGGSYALGDGTESNLWRVGYTSGTGVIEINGGTFTKNVASNDYGFFGGAQDSFYINNGTFESECGNSTDIYFDSGSAVISGGTFKGKISTSESSSVEAVGGTFEQGLGKATTPSGMEFDDSTKEVVQKANAAASIGQAAYASIGDAIAAADGETIVLLRGVVESVTIPESAEVTLDLNGFKITNTEGNHTITNKGTLTVKDSEGGGVVDNVTHGKGALVNYGTATVKGGTFTRSAEASTSPTDSGNNSWYVVDNQRTMTFDGGKVVNNSKFSSLVRNLKGTLTINAGEFKNDFIALKNDEGGTLVVKGGTVTSEEQSLQNWNEATLSGGTFNGRVATWGYTGTDVDGDNTAIGETTITGSAVVNGDVQAINYLKSETPPVVTVSGGTVNGDISKAKHEGNGTQEVEPDAETSTIVVTGGSFEKTESNGEALPYFMSKDVVAKSEDGSYVAMERNDLKAGDYIVPKDTSDISAEDLAPGFEVVENADGTFTVVRPQTPPPAKPSYDVAIAPTENGSVAVDPKGAKEGEKVAVTVKPDEGFELASLVVADEDGNALKLELNADGTYSFEMPAGDVTVHAAFECDGGELCPSHGFTDVDQSQWYHAAIDWAVETKVLNGIGGTTLMMPDGEITRAQMAQVLWNVEGRPAATEGEPFSDVSDADWFADAVAWASQEGIFQGYDGAFDPDAELTREQAAAVLMRWAASNGEDVSGRADLSGFPDADGVSEWAVESVRWAVDAGVLQGVANSDGTTTVSAQGTATRAQVAALMMRLEGQRTA